jgi:prefoldin subunit 4
LDDQQRINKFARLNSRLEEFKDDIKNKKNEIQTLEDAATDIMMMEDDEETVSKAGKSFALID